MIQGFRMALIEQVRQVTSALTDDAAASDELGRLTDRSWELLGESGILRALQPRRFGGGEVTLAAFVDAVAELSAAAPSAGWVGGVIGVHPWQLALFPEAAQLEMWGDDPARAHSSSYNPTGHAIRVDGGYRVNGRWSFSSGCDHCRGVNLGAIVPPGGDGDGIPDYRSFLVMPDQYVIEPHWDVAGLRGTGSNDIVVDDAFVPDHRSQSHIDYAQGAPLPGWDVNPGSLYRLPWSVVFNTALAASILGSARGYVDLWTAQTAERRIPPGIALADDPLTQRRLAEATWAVDAALAVLRGDAAAMQRRVETGEEITMADRGRYRWNMNRGCELAHDAVVALHRAASGRTIFRDHPLHTRFQDIQGGMGHAFLVADPLARAVGGDLLGTSTPEMVM